MGQSGVQSPYRIFKGPSVTSRNGNEPFTLAKRMNSMMLDSDEEQEQECHSEQGVVNNLEREVNSLRKIKVDNVDHQLTESDNIFNSDYNIVDSAIKNPDLYKI